MAYYPDVERYYEVVRRHLEERGLWEETIRKFPPEAIRAAIRRILDRLYENNVDPDILDWETLFEGLRSFPSVDAFISYLERERYIPPSRELEAEKAKAEIERELTELLDLAKDVAPDVLKRVGDRVAELTGLAEELRRLRRQVERLREEARVEREKREEYARRAKELEELAEKLRAEVEALRREVEEARKVTVRPPPAPPAPKLPPEVKARVDEEIRKVPRVYRIDWYDTKARISCHGEVAEDVKKSIEALGGKVLRQIPARPPLVIVEADFSGVYVPPTVPPELERYLLWSKFSAAITAAGGKPEEYRDDFEAAFEATRGLPLEERQRAIEETARGIVRELVKPPPPPPPAPPPAPPTVVGLVMPEPRVVTRIDPETGEMFPGPDDTTLAILMKIMRYPRDYFYASPRRQREEFRWPTLLMALEAILERPEVLIPGWAFATYPWIIDFLKMLVERLREAGAW